MICVKAPGTHKAERAYVVETVLRDFLGLEAMLVAGAHSSWCIVLPNSAVVELDDIFFPAAAGAWLTHESLPHLPLVDFDAEAAGVAEGLIYGLVPMIFARDGVARLQHDPSRRVLRATFDLFGGIFFLLSRYEEAIPGRRDRHGRFLAEATFLARAGLSDRPLVNEYVEILWALLERSAPGLRRKTRRYQLTLTHDVDRPFLQDGKSLYALLRGVGGDIGKRGDFGMAAARMASFWCTRRGDFDSDPANTFDWLMDISERVSAVSEFYFIPKNRTGVLDGNYDLHDRWIRKLIQRISQRGHVVGLHPSYGSFENVDNLREEFNQLREVCNDLGVRQSAWGGRQHYLRWSPATWRHWSEVGLDYDSSVGYAERPGFRCGTCYDFRVYDLEARAPLGLIERPLIVMEAALVNYMRMQLGETSSVIEGMAKTCAYYGGRFVLLWHNSALVKQTERATYSQIVPKLVQLDDLTNPHS